MKKYVKLIPLIIYPYAYLIFFMIILFTTKRLEDTEIRSHLYEGIFILFNVYVIFIAIYNTVLTVKGKYSAYEAAKINMSIKGWQIPAYIFHFVLGLIGFFMGIWGIGFLLFAIFIDVISIALTGISSIGCSIRMKKEGIVSTGAAIFMGIGCFIFCIDVVVAIVYVVLSRKKRIDVTKDVTEDVVKDITVDAKRQDTLRG